MGDVQHTAQLQVLDYTHIFVSDCKDFLP